MGRCGKLARMEATDMAEPRFDIIAHAQREVQAPLRGRHDHTAGRAAADGVDRLLRRVPRRLARAHPGHAVGRRGRDVERAGPDAGERRQVQRHERLLRAARRRQHRHVPRAHGRRDVLLLVAVLAQVDRRRPHVDGPQADGRHGDVARLPGQRPDDRPLQRAADRAVRAQHDTA